MKKCLPKFKFFTVVFALMLMASVANAQKIASVSGPWSSAVTWGGVPPPAVGDNVTINNGINVNVDVAAFCNSVTFSGATGSLSADATYTLTVTTSITLQNSNTGNTAATLGGAGTISCATVQIGGNATTPTTDRTTTLTSTATTLNVSGNLTVRSEDNGNNQNDAAFNLSTGKITVSGSVVLDADADGTGGTSTATLSLNNGLETGNLVLPGATPFSTPGGGTETTDFAGSGATVEYSGAAQAMRTGTYTNLILSGSGSKTNAVTVTDKLSVQGSNVVVGSAVTYSSAILEYKGAIAQTTGTNEFPAATANLTEVIIDNANGVTLNAAKTISGLLRMTNGTLNMANTNLSVGSLTGSGNLTHSSGAAGNRTLTIGTDGTSPAAYTGVISNGNATTVLLFKTGNGTLTLSGANTYTGKTTIDDGTLSINTLLDVSGGASSLGAPTTTANGTIDIDNAAVLKYTGAATSSNRVISLLTDNETLDASGTGTLTLTGGVVESNDNLILTGTGTGAITGVIGSGTGTLAKTGAGTWTLSGTNTYSGTTTISGGTLSINADANLGTGSLAISNGSTLKTTGAVGISMTRAISLTAGGGVFNLTPSLTLSGAISGSGGLTTGGSDLILNRTTASGNNAIGTINISSNRLFVFQGLNNINGSSINVASGATLDFAFGTTTPTNTMVFASGAGLANRVGTLTVSTTTASFPTTGTMIFNSDDQVTTPITVTGNYPALTGDLTMQVGGMNATVGAVTIGGTLNGGANFSLTKSSIGSLSLGTVGSAAVTLKDLNISGGTLVSTNGTMSLAGNFTNDAAFTAGTGTVTFNGAAPHTAGGTQSTTFNALTINSAGGVTLNQTEFLNGVMTFTNGIVNSNNGLITFKSGSSVAGTVSDASHIDGPIKKLGAGAGTFRFPCGDAGQYEYLEIVATTAYDFTAQYIRTSATALNPNVTAPVKNVSGCDHWTLDPGTSVPTATISVTLSWSDQFPCGTTFVTQPSSLTIAHLTGGSWVQAGTSGAGTGTSSSGSVTRVGVNSFSPFSLANTANNQNPLPVLFNNVKAFEKGAGVQIEWTNLTEKDVVNYTVERSVDGSNFTTISQVSARSNISDAQSYLSFDGAPAATNFYRIKVVEADGHIVYSKLMKVDIGKSQKGLVLYPNPVVGNDLSIGFTAARGQYNLSVVNAAGQQIYTQKINHAGGTVSQAITLPATVKAGVYNMLISGDNYKETKMFVIQ